MNTQFSTILIALFALNLVACEVPPGEGEGENEEEVITTINVTFTPAAGDAVTASHADPENDGDPVVDDITLAADTTYAITIEFLNELEDPAEDITEEVEEENDEHQIFYDTDVGTIATTDTDGDGNPVGLEADFDVGAAGSGSLRVILQHLPNENGTALKTADLQDTFESDGPGGLPGDADVDVEFDVTVE